MIVDRAAALPQIADQFFATVELGACRLVPIEIADETNPERDVVQVIAVHMAAVDLPAPAIAHFDLAVAGGSAVADDEMIGQPVAHPANVTVVIIERRRVALTCAAVVHDDELPTRARYRSAIDRGAH